jgi:hypothetical protein
MCNRIVPFIALHHTFTSFENVYHKMTRTFARNDSTYDGALCSHCDAAVIALKSRLSNTFLLNPACKISLMFTGLIAVSTPHFTTIANTLIAAPSSLMVPFTLCVAAVFGVVFSLSLVCISCTLAHRHFTTFSSTDFSANRSPTILWREADSDESQFCGLKVLCCVVVKWLMVRNESQKQKKSKRKAKAQQTQR